MSISLTICVGYLGFQDPTFAIRAWCDKRAACWHQQFDTQEAYQHCLDQADSETNDCEQNCIPKDESAAIEQEHSDCVDACNSEADDCNQACQDTLDTALAGCGDDAGCTGTAYTAFFACQQDCANTQDHCITGCDSNEEIALASMTIEDARCPATCCNQDESALGRQLALCQKNQDDDTQQAQIDYATCKSECITPDGGGYDSDCVGACANERDLTLFDVNAAATKCQTETTGKWNDQFNPCNTNWFCYIPCVDAQVKAARECLKADQENPDTDTYDACMLEANQALLRCDTDCCYNLNGRSDYDPQALECVIAVQTCLGTVSSTCPQPGTDEGEPCHDPTSTDCTTATQEWQTCVNRTTCSCNTTYKECLGAITDDPAGACGGQCVTPDAPDLSTCNE